MTKIRKANHHQWEVSIIKLKENGKEEYKVTRRHPELTVAETKVFSSKEEAQAQFEEWLNYF
jgi:hypothetical protein